MRVVIMGCGRVGSTLAARLEHEGNSITVIDTDPYSFRRLPSDFQGETLVGSGYDESVLEAAGVQEADAFFALTQGDNRNLLGSQIAKHIFGVKVVVARVSDPFRGEIFANLGLRTFSPTNIGAQMAYDALIREQ
ncbi:MAG: TrkA family potassium uptake protein [Chloroflexi bacterium]|nr:MAG: TrkA family potassium uptake protein [Chloroflexota bacterium]